MSRLFYDHLIILEEVLFVLKQYEVSEAEQKELLSLVDKTLNHHILDEILLHLPKEHHETFILRFAEKPDDPGLLVFLNTKTSVDMEKKIFKKAEQVKKDLIRTIHKTYKK